MKQNTETFFVFNPCRAFLRSQRRHQQDTHWYSGVILHVYAFPFSRFDVVAVLLNSSRAPVGICETLNRKFSVISPRFFQVVLRLYHYYRIPVLRT